MQFKSLILAAAAASSVLASPVPDWLLPSLPSLPGLPTPQVCLSQNQANNLVQQFKSILTNPDRKAAAATANTLLDASYTETSDSIDVLDGTPEGQVSFNSKQAFIAGVAGAPAIGSMSDLDIIWSCNKIVWQWYANGIGLNKSPVKGFNKFTVNAATNVILSNELEFNSVAWGRDIGWTCTPPPSK